MEQLSPPVDLFTTYALPVPSLIMCELLGVPPEGQQFFHERTQIVAGTAPQDQVKVAYAELYTYMGKAVTAKEKDPQDDLLEPGASRRSTCRTTYQPRRVRRHGPDILLIAGHETTASMIALSVVTLLQHPEQLAALRADPQLMGGAVDESAVLLHQHQRHRAGRDRGHRRRRPPHRQGRRHHVLATGRRPRRAAVPRPGALRLPATAPTPPRTWRWATACTSASASRWRSSSWRSR